MQDNFKTGMQELMQKMDFEIYENLKTALALGKWEDGKKLTKEQKENTMQLILMFEVENNMDLDKRVGFIEDACQSDAEEDISANQVLEIKEAKV